MNHSNFDVVQFECPGAAELVRLRLVTETSGNQYLNQRQL